MSAGESLLSSDEQLPYQSDKYKSIRACVKTLNAKSKMDPKGGNSFEGFLTQFCCFRAFPFNCLAIFLVIILFQ